MSPKHRFGTVKVQGYRIKFHDAPGFEVQEFVPKVGWVESNDTPLRLLPWPLLDAIEAFRPEYPLFDVMAEELTNP